MGLSSPSVCRKIRDKAYGYYSALANTHMHTHFFFFVDYISQSFFLLLFLLLFLCYVSQYKLFFGIYQNIVMGLSLELDTVFLFIV